MGSENATVFYEHYVRIPPTKRRNSLCRQEYRLLQLRSAKTNVFSLHLDPLHSLSYSKIEKEDLSSSVATRKLIIPSSRYLVV